MEEYAQALAVACTAVPHPGMLASLWQRTAGGIPGGLTVYDCGGGALLAVRRGIAALLGIPDAAGRRELELFLPFAGIRCLYAPEGLALPAQSWENRELIWMAAPMETTGRRNGQFNHHAVYPIHNYSAVAQLLCGDESEAVRNDFYAELCSRRNRGLGCVLALGASSAPEACAVCSGPVQCPAPQPEAPRAGLWQRLRRRLLPKRPAPVQMLPTVYLSDLFVQPDKRAQGYGRALLLAAGQLSELSAEARQLLVYCAPELTEYYTKQGFSVGGRLCLWQTKG